MLVLFIVKKSIMKKYIRLAKYLVTTSILLIVACNKDFLERKPQDSLTLDNFYQNDEQVNAATSALYGYPWFDFNDKARWSIGDAMGGDQYNSDGDIGQFFVFSVTQNNPHLNAAWSSLFRVVAHANSVINNVPQKAGAGVSSDLKKRVVGESKYLRAVAYFYLVRLWGPVPIIEDNAKLVFNARVPRNRTQDIFTFIIKDLEYAAANCPTSYTGKDVGRITSWAAKGMLAKVYLFQRDYEKAKELASDVVNNSGLSLMPVYADLFKTKNNNNSESLFALQWLACGTWGTQNTNQAYIACTGKITGVGDGWGGGLGPTIDLENQYEAGDTRRSATIMQDGDKYPEILAATGGFTYSLNDFQSPTLAGVKKYVVGTPEDNDGKVCFMSTGINTYIQRLSDVYLILAESILAEQASTSDAEALAAFNAVRTRGLGVAAAKSTITFQDIFHERRIEFALEGEAWYDLVRLHSYNLAGYNPLNALDIIHNQERGYYYYDKTTKVKTLTSRKFANVTDADFSYPIPSSEIDNNPQLKEDPVEYIFSK
jgi:starch-binding outer membrane protein, SusD/RagB family